MTKIFNCLENMKLQVGSRLVKFLLLSALWLGVIAFPGGVSAQVVDIPDPGLRAAIAQALNKAPGDAITRAEMETLSELRATFSDITDLRGIEFAINLTELDLGFNSISDLSPLSSLTNLTYLDLWNNSISDLSPLSSLTNLTDLVLWDNSISDLSPLASLTNLIYLDLDSNKISDLSPLSSLTNLTVLWLSDNTISDLSPLSSLTNLTLLYFSRNAISDISPLANLTNLTVLSLRNNDISDIFPLIAHANLERLFLNNNNISDLSPLANLTNLTELNLGDNNISDISPLANLTNLKVLWLGDNNISDILPLITHANLERLFLNNNSISDISPLANLTNLIRLYLQNNNISDVETLERLIVQGTIVFFRGNPAFETPGPKIEEGWVWLIVPATGVSNGSLAARSGRDFLAEASGGAVTEADVARNGARAGTRVGDSVWTAARLDGTAPNNLNIIAEAHDAAPVDLGGVPLHAETPPELGDNGWKVDGLDGTAPDKRNALMPDSTLETHIRYPVAYGVVPLHAETPQQTRVYIGAGPVKVYLNGTLVYRDTDSWSGRDYETAVPVTLNTGNNLLFIAAYRQYPWSPWGAFLGFQDGTEYTVGALGPGNLDVNGDGQVDVLDLVLVAVFYGTRGDGLPADVNADGVVNVQDFAAVAAGVDAANPIPQGMEGILLVALAQAMEIEGVAEAPTNFRTRQHARLAGVAYRNVAAAFENAKHLATEDVHLRKWVPLLKELLHLLTEMKEIPDTTALLPNYPNPFNPETWIPYHLATEAAVTLTIYDTQGVAVRALTLGHQPAGVYESRGRAAYWDGRNESGESVASGVYFYTLTAGDFTATRKLLIIK